MMAGEQNTGTQGNGRPSHESDIKVVEVHQVEGIDPTHAAIMATNKPDQWGKGYIRLYMLAACIFLNSTMNGSFWSLVGELRNNMFRLIL